MGITTADPHVCLVIIKDCFGIIKYCLFHDRLMLIVVEPLDLLFLDSLLKTLPPFHHISKPGKCCDFFILNFPVTCRTMTGNKGEVQRKIMGRKEKVGGNNNVDYCSMCVMSVQHRASSGAYPMLVKGRL